MTTPNATQQYYCHLCGHPVPDVGEKCTNLDCPSNSKRYTDVELDFSDLSSLPPELLKMARALGQLDTEKIKTMGERILKILEEGTEDFLPALVTLELLTLAHRKALAGALKGMLEDMGFELGVVTAGPDGEVKNVKSLSGRKLPPELLNEIKAAVKKATREHMAEGTGINPATPIQKAGHA